jgi:hypothetical protein
MVSALPAPSRKSLPSAPYRMLGALVPVTWTSGMFDDNTVALSLPNTSPASATSPVPITVRPRKSGSAKVVCPSPPYMVPSRENRAWFWLIGSIWPAATAQPFGAKFPAKAITSPRICCPSGTPPSRDGKMPVREIRYVSASDGS